MDDIESLIEDREELTEALDGCEPGAFPGSKESRKEMRCLNALEDFDGAYPEVITELKRRRSLQIGNSNQWI